MFCNFVIDLYADREVKAQHYRTCEACVEQATHDRKSMVVAMSESKVMSDAFEELHEKAVGSSAVSNENTAFR